MAPMISSFPTRVQLLASSFTFSMNTCTTSAEPTASNFSSCKKSSVGEESASARERERVCRLLRRVEVKRE